MVMDVRSCKMCRALYTYEGGLYKYLCPACSRKMEEKFKQVKDYIRENPGCNTAEVSAFCDVSVPQIERWIREERLSFSPESEVGLPCEKCGAVIKSGRYCERCRVEVIRDLTDVYSVAKPEKKKRREDDKMRYIGDE